MNEQLIVKNFGPIKDATVDFKRVTVFIGPTGGGKSTLAKLAAIFRDTTSLIRPLDVKANKKWFDNLLRQFNLWSYIRENGELFWKSRYDEFVYKKGARRFFKHISDITKKEIESGFNLVKKDIINPLFSKLKDSQTILNEASEEENALIRRYYARRTEVFYMPAERLVAAMIEVGISKEPFLHSKFPSSLLLFIEKYKHCRYAIRNKPLNIPFLDATYAEGENYLVVKSPNKGEYDLSKSASGIQAVAPMMQIIIYNTTHDSFMYYPKSFIIEEPELNLYPTAQRDLVYWLLEKCTQGENDLTITTHSPYVLSALNLALYAGKVAALFPHQHQKVAKIIPEKYWLKADEFSAYHVARGGVKSIFDSKTGLLSESQLDEVSGHFADVFDRLTDLRVPEKKPPAKAKPAKK